MRRPLPPTASRCGWGAADGADTVDGVDRHWLRCVPGMVTAAARRRAATRCAGFAAPALARRHNPALDVAGNDRIGLPLRRLRARQYSAPWPTDCALGAASQGLKRSVPATPGQCRRRMDVDGSAQAGLGRTLQAGAAYLGAGLVEHFARAIMAVAAGRGYPSLVLQGFEARRSARHLTVDVTVGDAMAEADDHGARQGFGTA